MFGLGGQLGRLAAPPRLLAATNRVHPILGRSRPHGNETLAPGVKGANNMKYRIEVCAPLVIALVIVMVFAMQPAAWSQAAGGRCQVVQGGNGFGGCNV